MNDPNFSIAVRKAMLDTLDAANGGSLVIYDGTPPLNSDAAVTTQNALVTFALGSPAFAAAGGAAQAAATKVLNLPSPASPVKSGAASWYRMYKSDGTTAVTDGTVGLSSATSVLVLSAGGNPTITVVAAVTVTLAGLTYTIFP